MHAMNDLRENGALGTCVEAPRRRTARRARRFSPTVAMALLAMGCARNLGPFVWVDQYTEPPPAPEKPYVIEVGDVIQVRVFNQDQLSARQKVRSDGKVSLPLLNDVQAAGYPPVTLTGILENRLKELVKSPVVTISIEESQSQTINVLGDVGRPGSYPLERGAGILQALATAGGLKPDASTDQIFVIRQTPTPIRIRFNYEALLHQEGRAAGFKLRPGDVVVVE